MHPNGRIHLLLLAGVAVVAAAGLAASFWVLHHARAPIEITAGTWTLRETHRELTGQQRSSRVLFGEKGRKLAVMCPRYNKVLLYEVTEQEHLKPAGEIALQGRPVAMAALTNDLVVLERPAGDDKHLAPGWWEAFHFDGTRSCERVEAGYYPDDLALTPDGLYLLVLSSGCAEGDKKKPLPRIDIYLRTCAGLPSPTPAGRLELGPKDDGDRLVVSAMGGRVLVTLPKAKEALAIEVQDEKAAARIVGRITLPATGTPYVSVSKDGDWMIMPTMQESEAVVVDHFEFRHGWGSPDPWEGYLLYTLPDESAVELAQSSPRRTLGRFPVYGPLNLGGSPPSGLAYCADRGLAAITTKPGTVHLVSIRSRIEGNQRNRPDQIASTRVATGQ